MSEKSKNLNLHNLKNLVLATLFILGILASIAILGERQVELETKTNLTKQLQTTLKANSEILTSWIEEKKVDAEVVSTNNDIQKQVLSLAKIARKNLSPKELIASPQLIWLRKQLGATSKKYGFVGFVIFNREGRQIGALLDAPVGRNDLKDISNFFQRSMQGESVVSLPLKGEVPLPDTRGVLHENWPTMFVSTPIKDESDTIQAVLAFRIRPEAEFSQVLRISRFGKSGESYVFDSKGLLLSESRFNDNLRKIGLLPKTLENGSSLNIYIKDPRVNLLEGLKPLHPQKSWPLTKMAASATMGSSGVETTPYNDYRGVPVVGAWTWLKEQNMGIASEIDASEALQPLSSLRKSFYTIFSFLTLACILGLIFRTKQIIAENIQREKGFKTLDEKLKTQIILDNVVDAIITINQQGAIKSFNQGAQKLFQYKDSEVLGRNIKMLMPAPYHSEHDNYLKRYLSSNIPHIIGIGREVTGLKKDGAEFPMDLAVSRVDLHDRIIFTGVIRDISERKDFESALISAKKLADEANKSKGDFLANMSHEIRTPMNGIIGLTHLAMKTELTPVQHDYLKKIKTSSNNLLTIINDILDVSKIEAGKLNIEYTEFNLNKVLEGVSDILSTIIQEKNLEFHFDIKEDVPNKVIGDPVRLNQILTNLVSNAVKFTAQGQVIISLQVLEKTQDTVNIEFSVKDTGIGLSEDQIKKLFKPFNQADTSTTRKFGGTGLGLTIVKKLVLLMGGDIRIESQLGKGSTFIFNVVLKRLPEDQETLPQKSSSGDLRVLVIDDSPFMRDIIMAMLKVLKFDATATSSYSEGLQALKSASPQRLYDLVIIDNQLPDATGAVVCTQIKNVYPNKETKTILISGFSEEDILKDIKTAEFDGFLHKPISLSSLNNMIQHVQGGQESKERIINKSEEDEIENLGSIRGAKILLVEDNIINQQIGCELLRGAGLEVSVVGNGQLAVEAVKQSLFDAVLMDIQMPIMDGYRATHEVRTLPQFKDLPIIAMTANATTEDRKKAFACGMNDHITKPIDPTKLLKTLVRIISPQFKPSPISDEPTPNPQQDKKTLQSQTLTPIQGLEIEDGLNRVGHNEDLYKNLLILFANNKADVLEKVESAVQQKNMEEAAQLLHGLKGVAGNIGAKDLTAKTTQIEEKIKDNNLDSEYEALMDTAKQAMSLLTAGIARMEEKYSVKSVGKASQPLPEYITLASYIEELENLLAANDMKASDYLETIEETFKETPIKDFLRPVKDHLSRFNFSLASETLAGLAKDLETSSVKTEND